MLDSRARNLPTQAKAHVGKKPMVIREPMIPFEPDNYREQIN